MIDMFLALGGDNTTNPIYPNSGPGPTQLIAGNETIGYFGEVTSTEFVTLIQWRDHLNPSMSITIQNDGITQWFKFMYHGRVIFIPKVIAFAARWQFIYQAGGVYGVDNTGLYPSGTPVNQYKPMSVTRNSKSWVVIPRLMTGAATDPSTTVSQGVANEYDDLLLAMRNRFGSYSDIDLNTTNIEIMLNSVTNTTGNSISRAGSSVGSRLKTQSSAVRPVFEVFGDPLTPV